MGTTWHGFEDCGCGVFARILNWADALLTQAATTSITYKVFDLDNNNAQTGTGTLTVADVVYDTAQTGGGWPYDDGYNFRYVLPASCFPTGGHKYIAELIFTPAGADPQPFAVVYEIIARKLLTS